MNAPCSRRKPVSVNPTFLLKKKGADIRADVGIGPYKACRKGSPPALEESPGVRLHPQVRFEANRRRRPLGRDGASKRPGALW